MIISLKSWRTLFRHSEVLRLRRELRRERAERAVERQQLIDAALTSRGGKPAFRESPPPKEPDYSGQYVPPGHPSRRPAAVPRPAEVLSEGEREQLKPFAKEVSG
jgi:hypothetical protein